MNTRNPIVNSRAERNTMHNRPKPSCRERRLAVAVTTWLGTLPALAFGQIIRVTVLLVTSALLGSANAETFNAIENGTYLNDGQNFTGAINAAEDWRNYSIYNLSAAAGRAATSGTFTFFAGNGFIRGVGARTDQFVVYDYVGDIDDLGNGVASVPIYIDLGQSNPNGYGSTTINHSGGQLPMPEVVVNINPNGLSRINALLSSAGPDFRLAVGGRCFNCTYDDGNFDVLWFLSGGVGVKLDLELEPLACPYPGAVPQGPEYTDDCDGTTTSETFAL